ncbi:MAG: type IV pilus secretin PilQ [Magnetococcales bacterium]|nr:type IV pilus secretin PilQ [Magnetococcales bacterium]
MNSMGKRPWWGLPAIILAGILLLSGGCKTTEEKRWEGLSGSSAEKQAEKGRVYRMVHAQTQEGERVSFFANKPLAYQIFRLSNPDRVVLMLTQTTLGPAVQPMVIDKSKLSGLFPTETDKGDSRIEVTLKAELAYEVKERDDGLDLLFYTPESREAGQKTAIQDLRVTYLEDQTQLRLLGHGTVSTPNAFRLNNPPRLVVDMVGVAGPDHSRRFAVDSAHATNALLVGGQQKSRLVVELVDATVDFKVTQEAGMPVIHLSHPGSVTTRAGRQPTATLAGIQDVQFTREGQGALIRVLLNSKGGGLKTRREDSRLFLSMAETPVVPSLIRRMDVRAFGGPVLTVDTAVVAGDAQLVITLDKIGSRHEVVEKEGEIMVRVHPAPQSWGEEASPYTGSKISLDFKEIDVQNALRIIAEISDLNIILSDSVSGTLTMRLVDVPWDQALALILEAKGLGRVKQGNVLRIAPLAEIQTTAQARLQARQSARKLEPFITELIPVSFADGNELRTLLMEGDQQHGTRLVSIAGTVSLDKRTNTLIVKDTAENVSKIRSMVQKLDKPIPQVLIEARIVEVDRNSKDEFGINWGFNAKSTGGGLAISDSVANAYTAHTTTAGTTNPRARLTGDTAPSNVTLLPSSPYGRLGVHLGGLSPLIDLDIEIAALEENNKAKTISSPRVLTANNKTARISQGVNHPYTTQAENGGTTYAFVRADLSLEVTPQVTPNNFITLQIKATNDSVSGTSSPPPINTKSINTQALVKDGETIVLGGIFQNTQVQNKSGVPGLSGLPLVGWLFRNHADANTQTELLIFITPHIIHPK